MGRNCLDTLGLPVIDVVESAMEVEYLEDNAASRVFQILCTSSHRVPAGTRSKAA